MASPSDSNNDVTKQSTSESKGASASSDDAMASDHKTTTNQDQKRQLSEVAASSSSDDHDISSSIKRVRTNDETSDVFDGADVFGLVPGDRIEVRWEIVDEVEGKEGVQSKTTEHWWSATLLEWDGRIYTDEGSGEIKIHVLEYDPYPEGGFPESSREDVIFSKASELVDINTMDTLPYKREGDEGTVECKAEDVEQVVNEVLNNAMKSSMKNFDSLPKAMQLMVAEKISKKKKKLVELLHEFFENGKRVATRRDMQELLAKTMQE